MTGLLERTIQAMGPGVGEEGPGLDGPQHLPQDAGFDPGDCLLHLPLPFPDQVAWAHDEGAEGTGTIGEDVGHRGADGAFAGAHPELRGMWRAAWKNRPGRGSGPPTPRWPYELWTGGGKEFDRPKSR